MQKHSVLRRTTLWALIAFLLIHNDLAWSWGALITGLLGPENGGNGWLSELMVRLLPFILLVVSWYGWLTRQPQPLSASSRAVMLLLSLPGWFLCTLGLQYLSVHIALLRDHDTIWPVDVNSLIYHTWAGYFKATAWKHALVLLVCTLALFRDLKSVGRTRDEVGE